MSKFVGSLVATIAAVSAFGATPAFAVDSASISGPVPADPVVGQNVMFTVTGFAFDDPAGAGFQVLRSPVGETPVVLASFTNPGGGNATPPATPPSSANLQVAFTASGSQSVLGRAIDNSQRGQFEDSTPVTFTVWPALTVAIPQPAGMPRLGEPVTLTANAAGGKPGLTYAWDIDGDGYDDGTTATITPTFTTGAAGPRTIRVRVTDAAAMVHTQTAEQTITLAPAATPTPTPAPTSTPSPTPSPVIAPVVTAKPAVITPVPTATPAPAGCVKADQWALVQITTTGCFTKDTKGRWTTISPVKVNGIPLTPSATSPFYATPGTTKAPGGRIEMAGAAIQLNDTTIFRGALDWSPPGGKQGSEIDVATFSAPGGAKFYGFPVDGTITVRFGLDNAGRYYANFPINLGLPAIFKAGPDSKSPGISSKIVLSVDKNGVRNDGFKLVAQNAYLGKLKVEGICFAFAPAGQTAINGCPSPSLDGKPYLTCNENINADRWSGSAVVVLPTESKTRVAAFGSVADSRLASLGGFADNLGKTIPLASGVYLNRIGVGICINPPPFKLRGDVGIAVLPTGQGPATVAINGYFLYTDAVGRDPWSLELGGSVLVFGKQVGNGKLLIKGSGSLDFEVNVGIDFGPVSVAGGVSGWIEPAVKRFLIQGYVKGCIWVVCARADGLVSNVGLAGCVDLGSITYWTLERDNDWAWYAWWRLHWVTHVVPLKGGFGYTWSTSAVSLLGSSCDFGPWTPRRNAVPPGLDGFEQLTYPGSGPLTQPVAARAQAAGDGIDVTDGTPAFSLKVTGAGGSPKLQVKGPDGTTFASPGDAHSAQAPGKWILAENPLDNTTSLIVMNPSAGRWSVTAQPGSPAIATIEESPYEGAPQVVGGIGNGKVGTKVLNVGFTLAPGTKLSLEEVGADVSQSLATDVRPGTCPTAAEKSPGGAAVKCASMTFTPAYGPGGKRTIYASISRDGMPISRTVLTTFRTRGWTIPARPKLVGITRRGSNVTIAWSASASAARYAVTVTSADGTKTGFDLPARCRAVEVKGIRSNAAVSAAVYGVRKDLVTGRVRSRTLEGGAKSAGPKVKARPRCH